MAAPEVGRIARAIHRGRWRDWVPPTALIVVLTIAWELVSRLGLVSTFLLPAPSAVIAQLFDGRSLLWQSTISTGVASITGFVIALFVGVLIAIAIISWRTLEAAIMPVLVVTQVVPKVAIAPLLIVYVGFGTAPKVVLALLLSFFPIVISAVFGLRAVAPDVMDLMRALHASRWQILWKVRLPGSVAHIAEAAKVSITLAVIGTIVGEFSAGNQGLGYVIMTAATRSDVAFAFAAILAVSLLGIASFLGVALIGNRLTSRIMKLPRVDDSAGTWA
jgi:NitT/TauT family transport system permease protein